jgi:hypothetical protein
MNGLGVADRLLGVEGGILSGSGPAAGAGQGQDSKQQGQSEKVVQGHDGPPIEP